MKATPRPSNLAFVLPSISDLQFSSRFRYILEPPLNSTTSNTSIYLKLQYRARRPYDVGYLTSTPHGSVANTSVVPMLRQVDTEDTTSQLSKRFSQIRKHFQHFRRSIPKSPFTKDEIKTVRAPLPHCFVDRTEPDTVTKSSPNRQFLDLTTSISRSIMDGSTEKLFGRRNQVTPTRVANVSAVFVHAGAGYHSTTNEHIHLAACDNAARMAMRILRAGGTAVDAVEAAIKVLEDKEITNAGFGSNLAIDGVVECDATIVDHMGRSGACGAAAQIKNPINLARAILDASNKPLSLRRVPPNLLVGQGATDFAWEQGIPVVAHEVLVSRNARDRYMRWREDLKRAEGRMTPSSSAHGSQAGDDEQLKLMYEEQIHAKQRRDHTNAILGGTWNEGQPDSPSPQPSTGFNAFDQDASIRGRSPSPGAQYLNPRVHQLSPTGSSTKRPRYGRQLSDDRRAHSLLSPNAGIKSLADVVVTGSDTLMSDHRPGSSDGHMSPREVMDHAEEASVSCAFFQEGTAESPSKPFEADDDFITDTVGAIAIDMYGQIAAGSSSGGIGMKHRGRVGPAALVGVGSAVIPADLKDQDGIAVAAVTSGTGEHMATTMASQKCAERLYRNTRRAPGGADIEATEEEAIQAFVQNDFMEHPGVVNSNSAGAIGVMAVKKTAWGYFLHFAHNTDSFALASMSSTEKEAKCVMSRLGDTGACVRGARKIRID